MIFFFYLCLKRPLSYQDGFVGRDWGPSARFDDDVGVDSLITLDLSNGRFPKKKDLSNGN